MATRAQVNTIVGRVCRRMLAVYGTTKPEIVKHFIRTLVSEAKIIGTDDARKTMLAILREVYNDIYGEDPVGRRQFRKWVQSALNPWPGDQFRPADPIQNVSLDDAFDAEAEDIT